MACTWASPPDWFKKKSYKYLHELDAAGSLNELQSLAAQREPTDLSEWAFIAENGRTKNLIPAYIGPPAVQVVERADQSKLLALEKPALLVQVSLRAPDRVIIEGFKKELQLARRETPAPVKMRGSKTAPTHITKMHFAGWIAHRIVQLCEIESWRNTLTTENKPSDADIGRWLFRDSANSRKEVITARKALTSALALVPALSAQISAVISISEE